eukprot:353460-Chlamydomonas_euryale.AAC.18
MPSSYGLHSVSASKVKSEPPKPLRRPGRLCVTVGGADVSRAMSLVPDRSVGMVFMPNDDAAEAQSKKIFEEVAAEQGVKVIGWRAVPVKNEVVGKFARATQPRIWQVLVEGKAGSTGAELDRDMFVLRKMVEAAKDKAMPRDVAPDFYICTLGNKTIVYKVWICAHVGGHRSRPCWVVAQHQFAPQ